MANWTVSDELDARLRERLGVADPAAFAERVITDHLDEEEDPAYQAIVDANIKASEEDIEAGRVTDAREAMRRIAAEKGVKLNR